MSNNSWNSIYYQENEEASFFQKFIGRQDEVNYNHLKNTNDSTNYILRQKQPEKILQTGIPIAKNKTTAFFVSINPKKNNLKTGFVKPIINPDWFFYLLIFILSIFALVRAAYLKRFKQAINSIFIRRYYQQLVREGDYKIEPISIFLSVIYILTFSLSFYVIIKQSGNLMLEKLSGIMLYVIILFVFIILFLIKQLFLVFTGYIFKTKPITSEYLLNNLLINHLLGICILPFLIFYIYHFSTLSLWILVCLIILFFIFRIIRGFILGSTNNKFSLFYLFLYLCTVEILPIIISIRLIFNVLNISI